MKALENKIQNRQYATGSIASAVVKRADLTKPQREKLLALVAKTYAPAPIDVQPPAPITSVDVNSAYPFIPPTITSKDVNHPVYPGGMSKLDQQLLHIAFQLLGLCIEHKLSRDEVYKRLEQRLMAGMG